MSKVKLCALSIWNVPPRQTFEFERKRGFASTPSLPKSPVMWLTDKRWQRNIEHTSTFSGIWKSSLQTAAGPVWSPSQEKAHYTRLMVRLHIQHLWRVWRDEKQTALLSSFWQKLLHSNQVSGAEKVVVVGGGTSTIRQDIWNCENKSGWCVCFSLRSHCLNPSTEFNYFSDIIQICHQISFLLLFTSAGDDHFHLSAVGSASGTLWWLGETRMI